MFAAFSSLENKFIVKVADTKEKIIKLLGMGSQYVCKHDGLLYFRKRKNRDVAGLVVAPPDGLEPSTHGLTASAPKAS